MNWGLRYWLVFSTKLSTKILSPLPYGYFYLAVDKIIFIELYQRDNGSNYFSCVIMTLLMDCFSLFQLSFVHKFPQLDRIRVIHSLKFSGLFIHIVQGYPGVGLGYEHEENCLSDF